MSETLNNISYIFFYVFPLLMLFVGYRLNPNVSIFPVPLKKVDLITPYLLISVTIQTYLAGLVPAHLYFYIFLSIFGIGYASYLAFSKQSLRVGSFFRTWWRYTFIFTLAFHLIVGAYGIYVNFF